MESGYDSHSKNINRTINALVVGSNPTRLTEKSNSKHKQTFIGKM